MDRDPPFVLPRPFWADWSFDAGFFGKKAELIDLVEQLPFTLVAELRAFGRSFFHGGSRRF